MGVVRKRELETHQSRLDMTAYERYVTRLPYQQKHPFIVVGAGFSGGRAQLGVRTTKAVKKVGCSNLKQMVEDNKIINRQVNVKSINSEEDIKNLDIS